MEFYAQLKESMAAGNSAKTGAKHPFPAAHDEIVDILKEISNNDAGKEKERLVVGTYILSTIYRNKLHNARSKNLRVNSKQQTANKLPSVPDKHREGKTTIRDGANRVKINKIDCVPDSILESVSKQMKLSLALYLSSRLGDSVKKDFIIALINANDKDVDCSHIVDIFNEPNEPQTIANVREYIKRHNGPTALHKNTERYVLCALIELAELLKDKVFGKLALDINPSRYTDFCMKYLETDLIHTIVPFEPPIARYIKNSIALCSQDDERKIIYNQYRTSPIETMNAVIQGLPDPKKQRGISRLSDKSLVFNPNEIYQCHKGPVGYTRDIVATYYKHGAKTYKILTYSDCLYDVIGCTTETVDQQTGLVTRVDELFDRTPWMDRLKMLPDFRAKVVINSTSGSEFNSYTGESSDITVSWFNEDGLSCSKTYMMKKPKDLKIKVEDPESTEE